jgi:hypothetical protein
MPVMMGGIPPQMLALMGGGTGAQMMPFSNGIIPFPVDKSMLGQTPAMQGMPGIGMGGIIPFPVDKNMLGQTPAMQGMPGMGTGMGTGMGMGGMMAMPGMGGMMPFVIGPGGIPQPFVMPAQMGQGGVAADKNGRSSESEKSKQGDKKD